MSIIECPHCYNKVLVSLENICPSCRKNVKEISQNNQDLSFVTISLGQKELPDVCIMCGSNADEIRTFSFNLPTEDVDIASNATGILTFLFFGLGFFKKQAHIAINYAAPICKLCTKNERLKPVHVNQELHELKILAHKKFKEQYYKLNEE